VYLYMNVEDMPRDLYKACRSLCFRGHGDMAGGLSYCREGLWEGKVVVCLDDHTLELLGWLLAYEVGGIVRTIGINVYVRVSSRRRGIGRGLTDIAKTLYPTDTEFETFPWDDRSESFFKSVGLPD
jgi:hypothetical protein